MQQLNRRWSLFCIALSLQAYLIASSCPPMKAASTSWTTDYAAGDNYLSEQKLPQAEASFRKALKELQQGSHNVDDESKCMNRLADALALRDKTVMAQEFYQKSLTLLEHHYGKDSKQIAPALLKLGSMYESEGDHTTAIGLYQRAMSINERNYGPYSPAVANSLHRLGRASSRVGDKKEAAKSYKAALSILMQEPGLSASTQMEGLLKDYHDLLKNSDSSDKDLLVDFRRDMRDDSDSTGTPNSIPTAPQNTTRQNAGEVPSNFDTKARVPDNALTVQQEARLRITPMQSGSATQTDSATPNLRPAKSAFESLIEKSPGASSDVTSGVTAVATTSMTPSSAPSMRTSARNGSAPQNLDEPPSPLSVPLTQTLAAASRPTGSLWEKQSAFQLKTSRDEQTNEDPEVLQRGLGFSKAQLAPMYKNLDDVIYQQNHYQESELLDQRKIAIDLKALGPTHPSVGNDLNSLALLYVSQRRYKDAEPLLMKAMKIYEDSYGNDNILVIKAQATLASVEYYLGNVEQAAQLYRTALSNGITTLGSKDLQTARILNELAFLYFQQGKLQEAATFYQWAMASTQGAVGEDNPLFAACMKDYAQLLRALGRSAEATALDMRADSILAQK
jgi:tetratricopeptide (TPR) repeat protein